MASLLNRQAGRLLPLTLPPLLAGGLWLGRRGGAGSIAAAGVPGVPRPVFMMVLVVLMGRDLCCPGSFVVSHGGWLCLLRVFEYL